MSNLIASLVIYTLIIFIGISLNLYMLKKFVGGKAKPIVIPSRKNLFKEGSRL